MFHAKDICGATVLAVDPVLLNAERDIKIREFVQSRNGEACGAQICTDSAGNLASVDLYRGDQIQRQVFQQNLNQHLFG